jgi:hypothetical protein
MITDLAGGPHENVLPPRTPPRIARIGDAYDNAMCESFFATFECELLDRRRFASQAEAPWNDRSLKRLS